jgi:small subunit ribosomal protein S13
MVEEVKPKEAQSEQSSAAPHQSKASVPGKEFRPLLRIVDKDVDGEESIYLALTKVKGIDFMLSNAICHVLSLPRNEKVGYLSEPEIAKIEDCMQHPEKYGIPIWMLNRRKDLETGVDKHLVGSNLTFQQSLDIKFLKKIRSYRGIKHIKGKRVRGQRSRTTGRKGSTIGVTRQKEMPKAAPKTEGKKEGKK